MEEEIKELKERVAALESDMQKVLDHFIRSVAFCMSISRSDIYVKS